MKKTLEKKDIQLSAQGVIRRKTKLRGVVRRNCAVFLQDPFFGLVSGIDVTVEYSNGSDELLTTDDEGMIKVRADNGAFVDLKFETGRRTHEMRVFIVLDNVLTPKGAWQRLVNMGYVVDPKPLPEPPNEDSLAAAVEEFQSDHGIRPTGNLDNLTLSTLRSSYKSTTPRGEQEEVATIDDDIDAEYGSEAKDAVA